MNPITQGNSNVNYFEVDRQMIAKNLSLSPQQRIENHQSALNLVTELRKAGENFYGKSQQTSQKTT